MILLKCPSPLPASTPGCQGLLTDEIGGGFGCWTCTGAHGGGDPRCDSVLPRSCFRASFGCTGLCGSPLTADRGARRLPRVHPGGRYVRMRKGVSFSWELHKLYPRRVALAFRKSLQVSILNRPRSVLCAHFLCSGLPPPNGSPSGWVLPASSFLVPKPMEARCCRL